MEPQLKQQAQQQEYQQLLNGVRPRPPVLKNTILAFLVGGAICAIGQLFWLMFAWYGLNSKEAGTATLLVMIFLSAMLTGLGVYDVIGKFGGAGSIIPITGFANSIVAPAMEFKREGFVFGVGARIFTVAGPVLVHGFLVSTVIGLIYFLIH